jgi:hypothetical protein
MTIHHTEIPMTSQNHARSITPSPLDISFDLAQERIADLQASVARPRHASPRWDVDPLTRARDAVGRGLIAVGSALVAGAYHAGHDDRPTAVHR